MSFRTALAQLFPGKPTFTENDIPPQLGKVFMITGGNAGLGYELVKILYAKGATVYMACRSQSKAEAAIKSIQGTTTTKTPGTVKRLILDLTDLTSVKPAVESFAAQESKLDVLWNNAGIGSAPVGTKTKQGYEVLMGTNALGPYLLTKLLLPYIQNAAKIAQPNSVRIVWAGSPTIETNTPKGGLDLEELSSPSKDQIHNYGISKLGNWFLASEISKQVSKDGIVSIAQNPGNLKTGIWDSAPRWAQIVMWITMHPPIYGAYSSLWAGLSDGITVTDGGKYGVPWGKWHPAPREDILAALKTEGEGGTGVAAKFLRWCEEETKKYT
ncbi:hypothetical protein IFR04_008994 [Cadophora malorum]|uniref:NAD(P)-binding protein n=1 Tax=Cadophora malorum TaxID=108018 RepID=A0A8H7TET1_9HELO|nr:hypothetical protein IFR04_008994 [Cadophora malorum]